MPSTVRSDGVSLAVFARGTPGDGVATIVLVHGWPDCHEVWDPVADRLAAAGHHVVSFDVRGVGASSTPTGHRPYGLERMVADIDAVIDAVSPDRPVHLVGHDWGGIEGWEYVSTRGDAGRVATYTTLSGPSLDHVGHLVRAGLRRPTPASLRPVLSQGVKSWYTLVLSLPVVRTAMWRLGAAAGFRRWLRVSEGIGPEDGYPGPGLAADAAAAVPLYRTNLFGRVGRPRPCRIAVPVHQIVARRDNYISVPALAEAERWVDDLTRSEIDAGHWSPRTHPDQVADLVGGYVTARADGEAPGRLTGT